MSYSIKAILHHAEGKNKLHKIQMLIIYKRYKITLPTNYRVLANQFQDGRCKGFKNCNDVNGNLIAMKDKIEKQLLSVIESDPGKEALKALFAKPEQVTVNTFYNYTMDLISRLTLSKGRLKHYKTLATQIKNFGDFNLSALSPKIALAFEKYLKQIGQEQNTVHSKMAMFNAIKNHAANDKLIKEDCLKGYKKPRYIKTIPDYLTDDELQRFKNVVEASGPNRYKVAGYYFLLSCFTGYRISDLQRFNYEQAVKDDKVLIRAKKNKETVVIPVYPALSEILEQVKKYPFYFTEQSMRKYVKELALLAGLNRKIKVHTARHTFAIMLLNKDFTIDEAAELLGDSKDVARIYARVTNVQLTNKVKEKLY